MSGDIKHVAIIMDGNGRWAKQRNKARKFGHVEGAKSVERIVKASRRLGVSHLTLYAFSSENWQRPKDEIDALMNLLTDFLKKQRKLLRKEGIRLNAIGELSRLPKKTYDLLVDVMEESRENSNGMLTLALSYGSQDEIVAATKKIATAVKAGELDVDEIDNKLFASSLYTANLPDPDLMIRTSGECRLSNFLLWQLAYAEFVFTDTLWPDFSEEEYESILEEFSKRHRRYGGV